MNQNPTWQSILAAVATEPMDHNGIYFNRNAIKEKLQPFCTETLLFTCFPKSASTYITKTLSKITGFDLAVLVSSEGRSEQQLDLARLSQNLFRPVIAQHHLRANLANLELMHLFAIKPVVHTRNIFDAIISFKEFQEVLVDPDNSMAFITDQFRTLPEQEKFDFIIDHVCPWYIHFHVSWAEFDARFNLDLLWTTYEEFIKDPPALFKRILDSYKIEKSHEEISRALEDAPSKESTRFNKGVEGRGQEVLSPDQCHRVKQLIRYFPKIDFSRMGL